MRCDDNRTLYYTIDSVIIYDYTMPSMAALHALRHANYQLFFNFAEVAWRGTMLKGPRDSVRRTLILQDVRIVHLQLEKHLKHLRQDRLSNCYMVNNE